MHDFQQQLFNLLFTQLLANSPKDTGNMVSNITYEIGEDYYKIIVAAPLERKDGTMYDYARPVNYNQQRTIKERRNYKWIERTIKQVTKSLAEVRDELS